MRTLGLLIFLAVTLGIAGPAAAQTTPNNRLCDPAFENCRTPLINLIRNETVGIDVGFWFMEDTRYANELVLKWRAGVPVRVVLDDKAFSSYGYIHAWEPVRVMKEAGIPMRTKTGSAGIFHFKMMLFAGQNVVEFSGANFSPEAFVPEIPYENYVDEVIMFSDEPGIVNSFKTRFDDVWTAPSTGSQSFANYANVTGPLVRNYPTFPIDPELNFSPWNSYASRALSRYKLETQRIDAIMYRITDRRHTDAMIATVARGVPVRLLSEPQQYRSETKLWHSWNIDRMYKAGIEIRHRKHAGQNHEKLVLLRGQGMTILGSSNWTSASDQSQHEHNIFTTKSWVHQWARDHFDRKWNNLGPVEETEPFVPLPPDTPINKQPSNGAQNQALSVTLKWYAGPWAHKYDVYLGTSSSDMTKILSDRELGPSEFTSDLVSWTVSGLAEGTTYYWKVVSRTMADLEKTGQTWNFTTAGTGGGTPPPSCDASTLPSGWSSADIGGVGVAGTACQSGGTFTVQGSGADIWNGSDEFRFAYRTLTGDGTITARVATVENADLWTKSGVMMRSSLSASAAHASMFVSSGKGLAFQRRVSGGGVSMHTSGGSGTAPYWVRLSRSGDSFTASVSPNGSSWTTVGTETISMGSTIYVGIPVTSHNDSVLATATLDNVTVSGGSAPPPPPSCDPSTLPSGWSTGDIGGVGAAGTACASGGTFTIEGSGADIWNGSDEFRFVYRTLTGNGWITARVATLENADLWTKAGVMMRDSLAASAAHASMFVSAGKGLAFQRRVTTGGASTHTSGGTATAPRWVGLERAGDIFRAYVSADGASWTLVGSETITMGATIYVGLPATSHNDGVLATATIDNVAVN